MTTCDVCTDSGHCPEYQSGAACVADRNIKEDFTMSKITMSDVSCDLSAIRAICDVAVSYAVGDANNDTTALDKLSVMLQVIQERVEALDKAVSEE